jgi:5'-deoxynucleotidase YfbR-like HD superfamily hydrolase
VTNRAGYNEIAEHYRQLINDGELVPGESVPSMRQVCGEFGVSITTANRAFRQLKDEGLTVVKPGVGTVVANGTRRAITTGNESPDEQIVGVATFLFEMGTLKRARRTGWWIAGVRDPESIAEHSHRTAILATVLAAMEDANPARACLLATLHDTQETRIGDIPHIGRRYLTAAPNEAVTADQVAHCPSEVAAVIQSAVDEHEAGASREALVALKTASAMRIADTALGMTGVEWRRS